MRVRVGCLFEHDTVGDAAAIVMVDPHTVVGETVLEQEFVTAPPFEVSPFADLYGNRCRRLVLPPGLSTFSYDAIVEISSENEVMPTAADVQHRIEDLPDEAKGIHRGHPLTITAISRGGPIAGPSSSASSSARWCQVRSRAEST